MSFETQSEPPAPQQEIVRHDLRLTARQLPGGLTQIELSNRWTRLQNFPVTCYLVGDVLIDTGFAKIGELVVAYLARQAVSAIACTHNHEDHVGNCHRLAEAHGCPVYLAQKSRQWDERVARLPFYRRLWWGRPDDYVPREMPERIDGHGVRLSAIRVPGHSATHTAFFREEDGTLFCGDLYVAGGVTALIRYENPYQTIDSLRRAARLSPSRLINGHGLILERPSEALEDKALKMEAAAAQVVDLHRRGLSHRKIEKQIFAGGRIKDRFLEVGTGGEFCRKNFIRACLRYAPQP